MNFLGKKRSLLPFAWLEAIIMPNLEPNQRKEQVDALSNVKKAIYCAVYKQQDYK